MYGLSDELIYLLRKNNPEPIKIVALLYALQGVLKGIDTISESTDDWSKTRLEELYEQLKEIIADIPLE